MPFTDWTAIAAKPLNTEAEAEALRRQQNLTKPPGSLGQMESLAIALAAMQGRVCPRCDHIAIRIFAADHGVAASGVSAFPQEVTAQMVLNFAAGGAAVAVLASSLQADFAVINLGTVAPVQEPTVIDRVIAPQTANLAETAAMTPEQLQQALEVGREALLAAKSDGIELFIAGEMGIANTTSASALMAAALNLSGTDVAGPGTGVAGKALQHKAAVIDQALALHEEVIETPLERLRCLGGFEIAAMVGAYLTAAEQGVALLIDGFISTVAASIACEICPQARGWMLFGHCSAEPSHQQLLKQLQAEPMLDLQMRLGEGSGAAVAAGVLRMACELHGGMATFADAGVSEH